MKPTSQNFQIFWQSPDLGIPTRALILPNHYPNLTLHHLKSSLFPSASTAAIPRGSFFFTLNGKPLSDSTPLLQNHQITPFSTLTLHLRFHGGGGDGGATGAESRDCYLNMYAVKKPDKVDPHEMRLSKWRNCSLSNEPLRPPVVIDKLGNFFNKEALVEALLKKNMPKQFWYIKGLKDMITVELTEIPAAKEVEEAKFQCPITGLEFNGKYKFYALKSCGHVLSAKGFKEVKSSACLICHKEFVDSDKIVINGTEEEVKELWEKMLVEKKVKDSGQKSKKLKNGEEVGRLTGKKHGIAAQDNAKVSSKKFKAVDLAPANATKEIYASIFTSSKKKDFKETYSCRSLPLGRN
ncbi:RTF2 RING-finger protein [Perilla frutescens var. hirtella]|uniref:RTF2 RING-finger protein n=1 Tax=Perilla frutescens var. hirtella TaxID=608512 RepID=A0AAD4P5D1_PERFH|nr:RTF2 RING-finger protein [Perilla frutescens var. hirtella]